LYLFRSLVLLPFLKPVENQSFRFLIPF
jgi:hypothetical protein